MARSARSQLPVVWCLARGEPGYPSRLRSGANAPSWPLLSAFGNRELLDRVSLGLLCSVACPGQVVIEAFDAIRELRDAGVTLIGGFHSPMERECLSFLLRGGQPVVLCPARHPTRHGLPASWREGLDSGRMLIVSPFGPDVRRSTRMTAHERNQFVAQLATALWIPHATPEGQVAQVAKNALAMDTTVFWGTTSVPAPNWVTGARAYNRDAIVEFLANQGSVNAPG